MNLTYAIQGYWLAREADFSPHTVSEYSLTFKRFSEFIGANADFESITSADIRLFLLDIAKRRKLSGKTRANYWTALSSLWTWAEKELGVEHIIRNKISCPEFKRAQIRPYTENEVKLLLAACDEAAAWRTRTGKLTRGKRPTALRDRAIITILLDTGLRSSELCNLKIRDYDPSNGYMQIIGGKGGKDRTVVAGSSGQRALWRYLATRPDARPGDPLLATRRNTHLVKDQVYRLIRRAAERAGVKDAYIHKFRHTFAINFLRNGGNLLELQEFLGHEKLETVRIYARLATVDLAAAQQTASPADNWGI